MRLMALLLAISGCAQPIVPAFNPELVGYIEDFAQDCRSYGADLTDFRKLHYVNFADNIAGQKEMVGVCWTMSYPGMKVATAIEVKDLNDDMLQKALMYHELGHCILNLDHRQGTIMSEEMMPRFVYETSWDKLVEDLCTRYK